MITLNTGFQLSWGTSAGWERREPTGEEHQVHMCSVQSTHGKHLNWVFICIVNCVWSQHGRSRREKSSVLGRVLGAAQRWVSVQEFAVMLFPSWCKYFCWLPGGVVLPGHQQGRER